MEFALGSWAASLSRAEIVAIFESYREGVAFEATTFAEEVGVARPEELNVWIARI